VEHYQTKRRRRDGRVIDVSLTVSPIRDAGGGIVGASKIVRDITDRIRQAEELQRAKDLAEAANRAKDDFIAALSHELRTPLTPVLMTVSDLEADARVPAELRDDIRTMRRNVEMEARLIDDLLDLTRIAQGKLDLKKEAVDAHRLIREAVGICKADVEAKRLTLTLDLRARRHRVRGDGARLQQVVWNLAKNATKFTPPGGAITITTEDADGDRLAIRVADTGIGIAPEVLPRIFDAFEQGGRETTKKFGGLGLGLAISKALVEAHGGTLAAFSGGQGEGATFTVQLRGAEDPTGAGREPADGDGEARRRDLRILLVDDHKDTLHVLSRTLKKAGHDVTTAEDLATALEASAARPFDLLVSDLGLPDGTGLDLMRRLTPLPGIALTGYGMEADIEKCREAGFVAHLTKPIDPKRLEAEIQRLAVAIRPMRATTP
jgi:signal transduction histidine kinase/ActR/RegA family two-component response regulator